MFPDFATFLVVDDSLPVRMKVKSILQTAGYRNVFEAEHGGDALAMLLKLKEMSLFVDVIISDWNMPVKSGLSFLNELKRVPAFSNIPFIMLTAESETEQVIKAISLGVTDYIVKPFNDQILLTKLAIVWKKTKKK